MKITLAIPNYNGLENLKVLIPEVLKEGFEQIYVLDDKSTDDSITYLTKHFPQIKIVKGEVNLGQAGNCNRILEQPCGEIIMFLDADMRLITRNLPTVIENIFQDKNKTVIGGQIITRQNKPMLWNYGYEMNLLKDSVGSLGEFLAFTFRKNKSVVNFLIKLFSGTTLNLEIVYTKVKEKEVNWVSEAVLCIRSQAFKEVGGYDPYMRYHSCQDLDRRLREKGYRVFFTPEIKVKHMRIDTFGKKRFWQNLKYILYFYKKHYLKLS